MSQSENAPPSLSSVNRALLRGQANGIEAILHIGKEGITQNVRQQAWDALEARELVKVKVQKNAPLTTREACGELCGLVHALPVQCIGQVFVIYRESREHKHYSLMLKPDK